MVPKIEGKQINTNMDHSPYNIREYTFLVYYMFRLNMLSHPEHILRVLLQMIFHKPNHMV